MNPKLKPGEYRPNEAGKGVIKFMEDCGVWRSVKDVYGALGLRRSGVRVILNRLVEANIVEKRKYVAPKVVYPDNWDDMGDYARRRWRKENNMPHRFKTQYEYRIIYGSRGKAEERC